MVKCGPVIFAVLHSIIYIHTCDIISGECSQEKHTHTCEQEVLRLQIPVERVALMTMQRGSEHLLHELRHLRS